ncbi:RelA/SpoT family protein [Bacteroidota bacterium]
MKTQELKTELKNFARTSYTESAMEFSESLFDLLNDLNLDNSSLITAFLFTLYINNPELKDIIANKYGSEVLKKSDLLQRLGKINFPETKKQVTNLRRQFIGLVDDMSLIFIKLAERLLVLKFAEKNNSEDIPKLAEECLYLYSPIAHRLGLRVFYQAMDDIAFKHLYPKEHHRLYIAIEKRRDILHKKLREMSTDIMLQLKQNNIKATLQYRVKRLYSIFLKQKSKNISLDDVFDLMAIRIVVDKIEDCYFVLGVTHSNWIPIEGRFRDWVTYPKPNGYRSIQTTVNTRKGDKFEIQIRTDEMNRQAEYGSAAHWAYKEDERIVEKDNWIMRLKEFLETDEYFENPYELQELLKSELKRDFIHVLTPRGDIKTLKKDSTAVDFAYAIHTDLGGKVTGAKVNGKLMKLKTLLKSGDVVEVITSKNAKPSRDWLTFVKTPKARSKILIWIKKHEKDRLIADGKRNWENFKKQNRRKLQGNADEHSFKNNLESIGFKSPEDFYSAISINSLKCSQTLLRKLYPEAFKKVTKTIAGEHGNQELRAPKIEVEGMSGILTKLSKCCNPIKGEPIIGYVTQKSEIKIHSTQCKYIKSGTFDVERFKNVKWTISDSVQTVKLKAFGSNYNNMLVYITEEATNEKLELKSLDRTHTGKNVVCINIELEIKDIEQLKKFIPRLKLSAFIDSVLVI